MKRMFLLVLLLLAGCFPVRPDTDRARACTVKAEAVADAKFRAGESLETLMAWIQNEGRAYDECMK